MRKSALTLLHVGCFLLLHFSTFSQSDFILLNQNYNPHKVTVNPAFLPKEEFYLGLPLISNNYLSFSNSSFTYRDLIKKKANTDSIYFDFTGFLSGLRKTNYISATAQTDLVSVGWREGRWYVNGRITEKFLLQSQFTKDLMDVAINGNGPKIGQTSDLGNLFITATHYREYAFGMSRDFKCKLRLGFTAKYLYGMENLDINRSNIKLNTAPVTFDLTGTSDILINSSGLRDFSMDSTKRWTYLFERRNRGFALDLGGEYKFNDHFDVFASVLDIGNINWRFKPVNYYNNIPSFSFTGVPIDKFLSTNTDTINNGVQHYLDSLGNIFNIKERSDNYVSHLPTRYYFGGHYTLHNRNSFQFLLMGSSYKGKLYPSASLGFTKRFNDLLEFSINGAYQNNSFINLGAGFTLNLGLTQFSVISDNLIGLFGQYNSRGTNLRAGITLVSGYDTERPNYCDKDGDGIPNSKDECPDVPGVFGLNGCPDSDHDGIADKFDECPLESGSVDMKGCPDRDHDGIADKLDKCPDNAGKPELNGCPDRDDDGIIDSEDQCPTLAGFAYLGGCPDRDLDSIPDKEDECPDLAGPRNFAGCPDTDGDGLIDTKDICPTKFGLLSLQGCPDSDKDGFADHLDLCPDVPGTDKGCPVKIPEIEIITFPIVVPLDSDGDGLNDEIDKCPSIAGSLKNNGCPELLKEEQEILNTAFENLEFETGKALIKESSYESLDNLAELLLKKNSWSLLISGHTDNVGKPQTNMALSKNRALALKTYMISKKINPDRLTTEWFGQTKPIASNKTPEGRQKNRRVEMTIIFEK